MQFYDVIKSRYSCRSFASTPVEHDKLERILEAGRVAPTAKNAQPVKIWVIQSHDALEKIKSATPFKWLTCPVILAVGGKSEGAFVRPSDKRNFQDVDASITATHLMLAIQAEGLGSTWIGLFDDVKVKEFFPDMRDYDMIALLPVGYRADDAKPSERHEIRKNISELVQYL